MDGLIHVVDLYPTFAALAGASTAKYKPLDGVNVWDTIATGQPSPRIEIVYDLATEWYEWKRLPFVFAIWAVQKTMTQDKGIDRWTARWGLRALAAAVAGLAGKVGLELLKR